MKTTLKIAAAIAALGALSACQHMPPGHCGNDGAPPDPTAPRVNVVDGAIVVDQEPLIFPRGQGPVTITWRLPESGPYRFPGQGIAINGQVIRGSLVALPKDVEPEITDCKTSPDGLKYSCLNKHTKPGEYKYTINVVRMTAKNERELLEPLDPRINNF